MILIRADANEYIGVGHVMRCLSIAKAFANRGESIKFVTADYNADNLIFQNGFERVCLYGSWKDMENELPAFRKVIQLEKPFLCIIDSYQVSNEYFYELSKITQTAYIDDINTSLWDVNYLINYNIYASALSYDRYKEKKTRLLLNVQYTPLREEFQNISKHEIKYVSDVLISAGGSDPERISEKMIKELCPRFQKIRFHVVVGSLNPRIEEIKKNAKENVILHINEKHMSSLMTDCDIAISAAGTTLYELCACGIPTITFTLADNQLAAAEQFSKQKIMLNAGDCRGNDHFSGLVCEMLEKLINDLDKRKELSDRMQLLVDGKGADRIAMECMRSR